MGFLMKLWPPFPVCFWVEIFFIFLQEGKDLWRCGKLYCACIVSRQHTRGTTLRVCRATAAAGKGFIYIFFFIVQTFAEGHKCFSFAVIKYSDPY